MDENLAAELMQLGATAWELLLPDELHTGISNQTPGSADIEFQLAGKFLEQPHQDESNYLTHWTRAIHGPWPDETEEQYIGQLLSRRYRTDVHRLLRCVESSSSNASWPVDEAFEASRVSSAGVHCR